MVERNWRARREWAFFGTSLVVLLLDQASKPLVRHFLPLGESLPQGWPLRLTHVANAGSAFGLLANQTLFLIFTSLITLVVLFLYWRQVRSSSLLMRLALGLLLGGGVGNLIDRLRFGQVTDFVDVGFWPVFNVADSAISVGTVLLVWALVFSK